MFPVGIDVSKNTLDLCMLYDGIKGRIKTRNIQNNRHSAENILRWLRLQHCGPEDVHVVMEATGVYHERLATEWICPYISRHLLSLNPLLARCRRYSR
ncbi:IS110 family transposase, partial [Klebsiella pneumoniae]|nr:IS110 family transposase [Klebsiella pneumoniae]